MVDSQQQSNENPSREQLHQALIAKADGFWATYDSCDVTFEEKDKNYEARQTFDESGLAVTMIKYRAEGLTEDDMKRWQADPTAVQMACNPRITREALPDVEGKKAWHLNMSMPIMISNRSLVTVFYEHTRDDGT